jgi:hypothetical protein
MKVITLKQATFAVALLGAVSLFQNCGKVNFSSSPALVAGDNKISGTDTPTTEVTPTPTPPSFESPSPTPTPPPTETTGDTKGDIVCYLLSGDGVSDRLSEVGNVAGSDTGKNVQLVFGKGGLPQDVCMPVAACTVDINNYLNKTGGNIAGVPSANLPAVLKMYVGTKFAAPCAHNPNLQHVSEQQIKDILAGMSAGLMSPAK